MQKRSFVSFLLAAMACSGIALASAAFAATPVFINELHYDNAGTDVGEAIEIAGPVGTNLSGWKIVLYNGSGGTAYDTRSLTGTIPSNCSGMADGVVVQSSFTNGIQNGSPDGIALVDGNGVVVQFLSYEGSFTATDGPAANMTSTDIGVSESSSADAAQSLQLTGSGSDYADFTWQAPATSSFGACNAGQSFAAGVDVPPTVTSTIPADGATDIALAANISIHFSEPVTLSTGWADLVCTGSGVHALSISGNAADYTLDPDVDLLNEEACTVTIHAADVHDTDGSADAMAADFIFGFHAVADLAPTVTSTTPAQGSTAAANANIAVNFSEPVSLDSGWYALGCDQSGSHTATVTGGPASFALNPDADFTALENCTLTIVAGAVHDQDGVADAMSANAVIVFSIAGTGGNYYAGVDTSSGPALLAWLHNRIKDHVSFPYTAGTTDTWDILNVADQDPNNPNNILDVYANQSLAKITGGSGAYNREHTWPNSLGFPHDSLNGVPNPPYTDLHMLHAADTTYNADRGNKPYADCNSGCTELTTTANDGFGGVGGDDSNWYIGPDGNNGSYEVWNHRKGDMARSVMYMTVRYKGGVDSYGIVEPDLRLTDNRTLITQTDAQTGGGGIAYMGLLTVLVQWSDTDPPDDEERLRNETVYSYQTNRNPFVDHPEWVHCVFLNTGCPIVVDLIFKNDFEEAAPN